MADHMLVAFGKYLRLVRDRRKLSLSDVVTLTKSYPEPIGKGYLSRVERGLARVGFSKMVALSRAYEIPLDAFGEKLALDLEVSQLKNAPNTAGKTFGELLDEGIEFNAHGMKWHCYAAIRDSLPRAVSDPLHSGSRTHREQLMRATLYHGVAAHATGRSALALTEFEYVSLNSDTLSVETIPIVFQQLALVKMRFGALIEARQLVDRAIDLARSSPLKRNLGDALDTHASLAHRSGDSAAGIAGYQDAFAAYKAAGRRVDCARTLNNLAQSYFDLGRLKAARRALAAADRLATELGADSVRARARVLLGEIESSDGNAKKASALWHDAIEIARRTRDTVVHFKAEYQLFKLSIQQNNMTAANALGRRLNRLTPWISRSETEVADFLRLYAIYRKPKQRGVAHTQLERNASGNPE